ncbi:peptidoglycan DD-metalloendopeptidase family protein [Salinisphaera japonica]|uniref:Peptidase M23 n=1 Tax=Salinisphaera japonica YTM-1 TaxID=1209778 RepID=A0A423PHQ1_9GAMM|nr:peptidoglycan DD-metalloendopeptidase family protein [Salinisphaera japonica]ROO25168.1 peptidase M23 [Salinisphaera japonica YTM-1]
MGRLVDQDYLWLRESAPRAQPGRLRRCLPFGLIPLAAAGVWYGFYTSPDDNKQADNTAPTSYVDDTGPGLVPAVAQGPSAASVRPVNLIQPLSQAPGAPTVRRAIADTLTMAPASDLIGDAAHPGWRSVDIEQGDTLSLAFERAGLSYMDSLRIAHMPELGPYFTRGLRAGAHLQVEADTAGRVQNLVYPIDAARTITLTRNGDAFTGDLARKALEHRRAYARGVIRHSFYKDAVAAGLSREQIAQLNKVLSFDIDFGRDIQAGDRFVVAYDELYRDGQRVGTGPLLASALKGRTHDVRAIRYTDPSGHSEYYRPDGKPMQRSFVRAPVDFTRISSPFNLKRRHPVLHRLRRHEGTDFAAPQGAPIRATGSGRVTFRGRNGGYGNMVELRHDRHVTMRFAHMSRFARGLSVGDKIKEGQVIGYVGMTGLATGPHVHYEFRVDGKPRNPQTVKLPGEPPLTGSALAQFKKTATPLVAALDAPSRDIQLADAAER